MRLMQFPQALESVLQTLERMRAESAHCPRASLRALEALNRIAPRDVNVVQEHAPPATPKVRAPHGTSPSNWRTGLAVREGGSSPKSLDATSSPRDESVPLADRSTTSGAAS